jgi:hypothetical protein
MHVVHPCLISSFDDDSFTSSSSTETLKSYRVCFCGKFSGEARSAGKQSCSPKLAYLPIFPRGAIGSIG